MALRDWSWCFVAEYLFRHLCILRRVFDDREKADAIGVYDEASHHHKTYVYCISVGDLVTNWFFYLKFAMAPQVCREQDF